MNADDDRLVYEIVDDEHPERNQIVDPSAHDTPPAPLTEEEKEAKMQYIAHLARLAIAQKINERRAKENARALKGRVGKRRKREKLAKASRKKNRNR